MPWPWSRPSTHPSDASTGRLEALERDVKALRDDMIAWEARASKLTRELSRQLKAIAEVERREQLKQRDPAQLDALELTDEEPDLMTRVLRFADGR